MSGFLPVCLGMEEGSDAMRGESLFRGRVTGYEEKGINE